MNLKALTTYISVVTNGSIVAAAKECNLTASAVSLQMKLVEDYFGQKWFDRSSRQINTTAKGREAANVMRDAIAQIESLRAEKQSGPAGRVSMGVIATIQQSKLPQLLPIIRDSYPKLEAYVIPGVSDDLIRRVQSRELDCAIAVQPDSASNTDLCWRTLVQQPFVCVAPLDAEFRRPEELLQAYEWVRYDLNSIGGKVAARYVADLQISTRSRVEMYSSDSILALVAAGYGVSVIPEPMPHQLASHKVRVVELGPNGPTRMIGFVFRADLAEDRRLKAIFQVLCEAEW